MIYNLNPSRIENYVNANRLTPQQIKAETGCDCLINTLLFELSTFKPCCHLKVNGQVIHTEEWTRPGYGWNNGDTLLSVSCDMSAYENYVDCVDLIVDGKKVELSYPDEMGGKRGRPVIAVMPDGSITLYASQDSTDEAMTIEQLQEYIYSLGCIHAITFDSGTSVQLITPDGELISTDANGNVRIDFAYMLFWSEKGSDNTDKKKICIDAGHGGSDPGAIGFSGSYESKYNLIIALAVGEKLSKYMDVIYTRTTDEYVGLEERANFANDNNADIFLSIHFNSNGSTNQARGIETYCYSLTGEGGKLAKAIQESAVSSTGMQDRGAKEWPGLAVIRLTSMPAALIEGGFINNAEDEQLIMSEDFQAKLADGIVSGVLNYFGIEQIAEQEEVKPWYADAQAYVVANGISDGTRPTNMATRAEIWEMFRRAGV